MANVDNKTSAAGYILTFFQDVENLTTYVPVYTALICKLDTKYGKTNESFNKLDETEKANLVYITDNLKNLIYRTYIKINSLKGHIKEFSAGYTDIEKFKELTLSPEFPERKDVDEYVKKVNELFVNGVVSELLAQSQEIYAKFVGTDTDE